MSNSPRSNLYEKLICLKKEISDTEALGAIGRICALIREFYEAQPTDKEYYEINIGIAQDDLELMLSHLGSKQRKACKEIIKLNIENLIDDAKEEFNTGMINEETYRYSQHS